MKPFKTGVTFAATAMLLRPVCDRLARVSGAIHAVHDGAVPRHRLPHAAERKATLAGMVYADVALGIWAFLAATFFAWLSARLSPTR